MTDKEIAEIYRQMELEIIASMKRNLALHEAEEEETGLKYPQWQAEKLRSLRQYRKENKRIFAKYTKKLPAEVQKQLKKELKQGYSHEIEKYRSIIGEDRYRSAMAMKDGFFGINTRKADALIKEIKGSLFKANTAALRMADDTYRQVITKAELFLTNGVYTEKQAYDMAVKNFLERGLNCIEYKDGRRVNIDDYASMAVRTASQRAYLIGEGEFRKQTGRTLIMISRHNTSCEKCRPFESKVLIDDVYSGGKAEDGDYMLLSTAMGLGLFHPRCRHGCGTYFPELEDITGYDGPDNRLNDYGEYDKAGNADKSVQRHQHAQRMVQKYKRLTVGSADEQNIAKYQKRLDYWQEQEKALSAEIVDNNGERGIIDTNKKEVETVGNSVHYIGRIDKKIYSCVTDGIITDEVIITDERIEHIKERHPDDYEKYMKYIQDMIEDPLYIIEANKDNTAVILKEYNKGNERFKLILKIKIQYDPEKYKNSVISFWKIGDTTWKKTIKNKKILYKKE